MANFSRVVAANDNVKNIVFSRQLTREQQELVEQFHDLFYKALWHWLKDDKNNQIIDTITTWGQVPVFKNPLDLWVMQEIVCDTKPDIIIESGTAFGGSGLFLATICDLIGNGHILSIDVASKNINRPKHRRLHYLEGDILGAKAAVEDFIKSFEGKKVMFIFDDDHSAGHVYKEMELYAPLVSPHCYMIVEDGNVNGHPVRQDYGPGPLEAIEHFLPKHPEFLLDDSRDSKYLFSFNPKGYLFKLSQDDMNE